MPARFRSAIALAALSLVAAQNADYLRAKHKIDSISQERVPAGAVVTLTAKEINAWAETEAADEYPDALRRPVISLGEGRATGQALIDFSKLTSGQGAGNWLLRMLLEGERPVSVTVRLESADGMATLDLERVEISGVPIEGRTLSLLLDYVFRPRYPEAKIGEPFELSHHMEAIRIRPERVEIKIKSHK
jgi:hypothetical protein